MQHYVRTGLGRFFGAALAALFVVIALTGPAFALTTGSISGTVSDAATKKPLAGANVTASSPTGRASAVTDANGFYNLVNLSPDTYTVSISAKGYDDVVLSGVTVVQDQNVRIDQPLSKSLKVIGHTTVRSASNLVQPTQTADVYNVSAQQLSAAAGDGGHRTLYDVIQTSPGVTSTGVAGRPRIRGSDVGDVAWEFDGIPINDRLTGLFTTNLSIVGTQNLEVYTGGYNASYGNASAGVINSVVKRGTYPSFGGVTYTMAGPTSEHDVVAEYGGATRDGKWSWYGSLDSSNSDGSFANGYQPFINARSLTASDSVNSTIYSRDVVGNVHFKPSQNDDIQFLVQSGSQKIPFDKGLVNGQILGIAECSGVVVTPGTLVVTNPGVSASGQPCVVNGKNTGLQYIPLSQQDANTWYHWSNLGKIQWNHVFSDKLFMQARLAENFNQYIFYQPFDLTTINGVTTPGAPAGVTGFTAPFTPAARGIGYQDEYSDRRSQMYLGNVDLTFTPNAHATYYGGVAYERDNSAEHYLDYCGCDDAVSGSPFNVDGSYPNLFLAVDYPLTLPSAYVGTKQTFGKLTVEPSVRYDEETYHIPNRPDYTDPNTGKLVKTYAYGPTSTQAWTPRVGLTWAFGSRDTLRGSYGATTTFVPAAYVFNNSPNGITDQDGRAISPYYPGSSLAPQRDYNADLSFEHALRNGVDSWRVSPFYRHATNKLEAIKNYVIDPVTGLPKFSGTSYFRDGIENRATGVEFGWNHVVRGDGLSWYLSGTYINYWGSVTAGALAGGTPYGGAYSGIPAADLATFLTSKTLFRNSSQPPWSLGWTGDYRKGRFHADPYVLMQTMAPYNVYVTPADPQVHYARANWWASLDFGYDVVKNQHQTWTLGANVRNLFNNIYGDVYPSTNGGYPNKPNPDLNTYGPGSVPNTQYYYAPDAQQRQVQVYLQTKF